MRGLVGLAGLMMVLAGPACAVAAPRADTVESLVKEARKRSKAKSYGAAVGLFAQALKQRPGDPGLLSEHGWVAFLDGQHGVAEASLKRAAAVAKEPKQLGAIWYNLGRLHEARGERSQARTAYERSLKLRPNKTVQKRLGQLDAGTGGPSIEVAVTRAELGLSAAEWVRFSAAVEALAPELARDCAVGADGDPCAVQDGKVSVVGGMLGSIVQAGADEALVLVNDTRRDDRGDAQVLLLRHDKGWRVAGRAYADERNPGWSGSVRSDGGKGAFLASFDNAGLGVMNSELRAIMVGLSRGKLILTDQLLVGAVNLDVLKGEGPSCETTFSAPQLQDLNGDGRLDVRLRRTHRTYRLDKDLNVVSGSERLQEGEATFIYSERGFVPGSGNPTFKCEVE